MGNRKKNKAKQKECWRTQMEKEQKREWNL